MIEFNEHNINEFIYLKFSYISFHWKMQSDLIMCKAKI